MVGHGAGLHLDLADQPVEMPVERDSWDAAADRVAPAARGVASPPASETDRGPSEMSDQITPEEVQALFTRSDGSYLCARWERPIAPVVFGVEERTLATVKGAFEAVTGLAGHEMAETDPELGTNVLMFFFKDWRELLELPDLGRMIEGLDPLVARLEAEGANQYRVFRFEASGAIRAAFVFLRMDADMAAVPAETLALAQVAQIVLLWSDTAFADRSPLGRLEDGRVILRPEIAGVIRAAYDPVMPVVADDPAHALRLWARMQAGNGGSA